MASYAQRQCELEAGPGKQCNHLHPAPVWPHGLLTEGGGGNEEFQGDSLI